MPILDAFSDQGTNGNQPPERTDGKIRVLVAMDRGDVDSIALLSSMMGKEDTQLVLAGLTWDGTLVYSDALEYEADAVLLSPQIANFDISVIEKLANYEHRPIITVGVIPRAGEWAITLEDAGAVGHIYQPLDASSVRRLETTLAQGLRKAEQYRDSTAYVPDIDRKMAQLMAQNSRGWARQVITVYSNVGGVGKTTTAVQLATILGVKTPLKVLLIDADMNKGDVHTQFGLAIGRERVTERARNLYALAKEYDRLAEGPQNTINRRIPITPHLLNKYVTRYGNSGLFILKGIPETHAAVSTPSLGALRAVDFMNALIDTAAQEYDFVIIDCGQSYNQPVHMVALERAHQIQLVVNTTFPSLYQTQKVLRWATRKDVGRFEDAKRFRIYLDRNKVRILVNKFHERHGINRKEIQKILLDLPIFTEIPVAANEETVIAVNTAFKTHKPLVLAMPESPVSQAHMHAAALLYPPLDVVIGDEQRGKSRVMSWLLGG